MTPASSGTDQLEMLRAWIYLDGILPPSGALTGAGDVTGVLPDAGDLTVGAGPSKQIGGAWGPSSAWTDSGPPERTMPRGANSRIALALASQGQISQYTPISRMRRAISCVYCDPKSTIKIRC